MQINEILQNVNEFSKNLFGDKLVSVLLYGSYARGDYRKDSDVDILVLVDLDKSSLNKYRPQFACLGTDLNLEFDVFVSFKLQDKRTFEQWKNVLPFFVNVIKDGIVSYG